VPTAAHPSRRASTTPLFPSPLAQALSAQGYADEFEPFEMSDGQDADDEDDNADQTAPIHRNISSASGRQMDRSPVMRTSSPLRQEVAVAESSKAYASHLAEPALLNLVV
jgi:hypothetical protein